MQGNLFVVGDADQAIYGWRGANNEYMLSILERDYKGMICNCWA